MVNADGAGKQACRGERIGMSAAVVSPELALVDPELRRWALAQLPSLGESDFLRTLGRPAGRSCLDRSAFDDRTDGRDAERIHARVTMVAAYATLELVKVLVVGAAFATAIAIVVAALQLVGR